MIVGTAGHIDHGKTTLVRALTGVDTDRLPEEKKRGISIELGYAFLDVPPRTVNDRNAAPGGDESMARDGRAADAEAGAPRGQGVSGAGETVERIGFIDVPGHERLVHTMLAGATGIDFGLLLVAADDGVMPQTREHLAVLSLLGISRGAVAITKIDRVDAVRVEEVRREVSGLLASSSLVDAPVHEVSAQTGQGVAALRELLFDEARRHGRRNLDNDGAPYRAQQGLGLPHRSSASDEGSRDDAGRAFRLAIDRAFTLNGVGTVVTGTIHAGSVQVDDEVVLTPSRSPVVARVRSLHAQNTAVTKAVAGQRCAVALAGVAKDQISRGQWLVASGSELQTDRLDAWLTLWHEEPKPLRSGTAVHVHVGAVDVLGTVAVLGRGESVGAPSDALSAGKSATVQIVLREAIGAWHGDRVVLRDASSSRTIAGGVVLDPFAPARYRRTPQRLNELAAWAMPSAIERRDALVEASPAGLSLGRWRLAEGLATAATTPESHAGEAFPSSSHRTSGMLVAVERSGGDQLALAATHAEQVSAAALEALSAFHAREPDAVGPDVSRLRRLSAPRLAEPLWRGLLGRLRDEGRLVIRGSFVHLPEHGIRLSATDQRISQKIAPILAEAGFEGSWARDLAKDTGESEALMRTALSRLAQGGELHQVVKDLYYPTATMERLAAIVRGLASGRGRHEACVAGSCPGGRHVLHAGKDGAGPQVAAEGAEAITAAAFRDTTGLGRKRAIQLLEYFDKVGLLRRVGDTHRLRPDSDLFTMKS